MVVSKVGSVDKDEMWAEKSYSQSIVLPHILQKNSRQIQQHSRRATAEAVPLLLL